MNLWSLVWTIFWFNLITFGGGPIMIPLLQQRLVDQLGVITVDQLLYAFAIARVTPGQANIYVASLGYMLFGLVGAILVTLAIQLPGYVMLLAMRGYEHVSTSPLAKGFTRGLTTASVGLIFAATVGIGRRTLTNPAAWVVFPVTLVFAYILKWNAIISLLLASALGIVLHLWLG